MASPMMRRRSRHWLRSSPIAARSGCRHSVSSPAAAASTAPASSFRPSIAREAAYIRLDLSSITEPRMTRSLTVAALQLALPGPVQPNIDAVTALVEEAAAKGAQVILPPELFEGPYFCQIEDEALFATARPTA